MKKKLLGVLLCVAMSASMLAGCGGGNNKADNKQAMTPMQATTRTQAMTLMQATMLMQATTLMQVMTLTQAEMRTH